MQQTGHLINPQTGQLMNHQGNNIVQQVVLQNPQQLQTVTVTSSGAVTMPNSTQSMSQAQLHNSAANQSQAKTQIIQMGQGQVQIHVPTSVSTSMANDRIPASSYSISTMANPSIVTTVATQQTNNEQVGNQILGPLASPQTPLQPPQNPLIAMTTMSTSPMTSMGSVSSTQKDKHNSSMQAMEPPEHTIMKPQPPTSTNSTLSSTSNTISTSSTTNVNMLSLVKKSAEAESKKAEAAEAKKKHDEEQKLENSQKTTTSSTTTTNSANVQNTMSGTSDAKTTNVQGNNSFSAENNDETPSKGKKSTNSNNANHQVNQISCKDLPKAMVKPNVLTHVIEGFVIQEANEPFPVTRQRYSEKENDEPPRKKVAGESPDGKPVDTSLTNGSPSKSELSITSTPTGVPQSGTDLVACEKCGKQEIRSKLKKKRFCSMACARAGKNDSIESNQNNSMTDDSKTQSSSALTDKCKTPNSAANQSSNKMDVDEDSSERPLEEHVMSKWTVAEVSDFIKNLPGCSDYAEDFALQEIDGQALLLLKENHLVCL